QHTRSPLAGRQKGCVSWSKGKKLGPNLEKRFSNDQIFIQESTFARHLVKARILEQNLIEYKCAICGVGPEWCGNPMPLILDHENGINNDNRLENLRFVCSNCDTQLPTYK